MMKIKQPKFKYGRVLLIDDNDLDNFINQKILESVHFAESIYVNTSAKSALEFIGNLLVNRLGNVGFLPEVIFIDINMPIMDGFQFIEHFQQKYREHMPESKLVILTSSVYDGDQKKALELVKDIRFLNKPLKAEHLKVF